MIPVKPAGVGKSRLGVPTPVVRAIALDTIAAAAAATRVRRVIVVTADAPLAAALAGPAAAGPARLSSWSGVEVLAEHGVGGLTAAVLLGLDRAGDVDRAVLLGDLPALRPADLDAALLAAESVALGVVADAEGAGSTMITARAGATAAPRFGAGSFGLHRAAGHVALDIPADSTLRHDVDTLPQLRTAATLGLGRHTAAALAST